LIFYVIFIAIYVFDLFCDFSCDSLNFFGIFLEGRCTRFFRVLYPSATGQLSLANKP